jgi:hypothetical protein
LLRGRSALPSRFGQLAADDRQDHISARTSCRIWLEQTLGQAPQLLKGERSVGPAARLGPPNPLQNATEAVPVAGFTSSAALLLGRHERGGPSYFDIVVKGVLDETKVQEHDAIGSRHEHVGGLEIAVKLAGSMQSTDAVTKLHQGRPESLPVRLGVRTSLVQVGHDISPGHELHRKEGVLF